MANQRLADRIELTVPDSDVSPFAKHVLIYFLTGNPGFIEYYRGLFNSLASSLKSESTSQKHKTQYHIHGESLPGFEFSFTQAKPFSLDEVKRGAIEHIQREVEVVASRQGIEAGAVTTILVGHSIGTWLILEGLIELQKKADAPRIHGGILLFPTVFDLAKSPSGLRFGWILRSSYAPAVIASIAQLLFLFVPVFVLTVLLQLLMRMPYHEALVTASMLKSRRLVKQALYMAHCELKQLKQDEWPDELWGVKKLEAKQLNRKTAAAAEASPRPSKLFFLWGQDDHWVANATRNEVIAQRARTTSDGEELKPVMVIDEHRLPHAFVLADGGPDLVADKIVPWVHDIEESK